MFHQSLLCSPRLTSDLATFVIQQLGDSKDEDQNETTEADDDDDDECWDSVRLLCLTKLNTEKATEQIVDKYSSIAGMFAASCFSGDVDKVSMDFYHIRYSVLIFYGGIFPCVTLRNDIAVN